MSNFLYTNRAPFLGLVFISLFIFSSLAKASEKMANSPEWKSLLYYENEKFLIKDESFYLSKEKSLKSELKNFIDEIKINKEVICRFPARYTYLTKVMGYDPEDLKHCTALNDFKKRAPLEKASVVFASENISIPSSMMGHIYLKLEGMNHQQQKVEHAISYFTDVDDYNIPKLIFDTLIVGKKGFYALTPNAPMIEKYLKEEERNVWEYELDLTDYQKDLLHNHLFELKNINLTYFFHTFNCATLLDKIINVVSPQNSDHVWVTPLDVVRDINKKKMVGKTKVYLANKWKIKALLENYDFDKTTIHLIKNTKVDEALDYLKNKEANYSFISTELLSSYLEFKGKDRTKVDQYLNDQNLNLDLSHYKNPNRTKSTSQIMGLFEKRNKENLYKMTWLPASHFIEDDSSNYIYESELQIARVTLGYNESRKNIFLDEFNVYSATSLQASDVLTGGLSGKVRIGYYNYVNSDLLIDRSIILQGSVGKTKRIHHDIDAFGLVGLRYLEAGQVMFSPDLEAGFILRGLFKMKTIGSLKYQFEDINKDESLLIYNLKHFIDLDQYGLVLDYSNYRNHSDRYIQNFSIGFKYYF